MAIGDEVSDYFFFPLLWNLFLYQIQVGKFYSCNALGAWGLFWYNDNGELMNACFNTGITGAQATFIEA